jgi:hypothetical protein
MVGVEAVGKDAQPNHHGCTEKPFMEMSPDAITFWSALPGSHLDQDGEQNLLHRI